MRAINKRWIGTLLFILLVSQNFIGCGIWRTITKKKTKKALPRMLVLPFTCDNSEIGEKITKGFIEQLNKKIEVLDQKQFESLLSSISLRNQVLANVKEETQLTSSTLDSLPGLKMESKSVSTISFSSLTFFNDLLKEESFRTKVRLEAEIDYIVAGFAKEKIWSELEQGYPKTAETAWMKLLELKHGEILLEEKFAQGFFEVVYADRIGNKFSSRVNKKLSQIRKEIRKKEKLLKKGGKISDYN